MTQVTETLKNNVFETGVKFITKPIIGAKENSLEVTLALIDDTSDTKPLLLLKHEETAEAAISIDVLSNSFSSQLHSLVHAAICTLPTWRTVNFDSYLEFKPIEVECTISHTAGYNEEVLDFVTKVVKLYLYSAKLSPFNDVDVVVDQNIYNALFGKLKSNKLAVDGVMFSPLLRSLAHQWLLGAHLTAHTFLNYKE